MSLPRLPASSRSYRWRNVRTSSTPPNADTVMNVHCWHPAKRSTPSRSGAASLDFAPPRMDPGPGTVEIQADAETLPALSSGLGLGPFRTIKPDLIGVGGTSRNPRSAGG